MKARKKPVVVEVMKTTDENVTKIKEFVGDDVIFDLESGTYYIKTLEGNMKVTVGDYIIKGVNNEFYPCKPDIFEKTYEIID